MVLEISQSYFIPNWASAYRTTVFTSKMAADWHCTSACDQNGKKCFDIGPFGHWSNNVSDYVHDDKMKPVYVVDYCLAGTSGCFLINGCWKWVIGFHLDLNEEVEVMSITDYKPVLSYTVHSNLNDIDFDVTLAKPLIWNHDCFLKTRENKFYQCGQCSFNSYPEAGKIGEIQMGKDYSLIASHELSQCEKDRRGGPVCSVQNSTLKNHLKNCKLISDTPNNRGYSFNNGWMMYRKDGSVVVRYLSSEKESDSDPFLHCGGPVFELWVVEHSGNSAKLQIKSKIEIPNESIHITIPCSSEILNINCDNIGRLISVSWPNNCLEKDNNIKKHITDMELVDYRKTATLHYVNPDSGLSFNFRDFLSHFHMPTLFSILGSNILIVGVALICILKK